MRSSPPTSLRILTVCSATRGTYGAVRSMRSLTDALTRRGHWVGYVGWQGRGLGAELRSGGYDVQELKVRAKVDPYAAVRLSQLIRRAKVDVVHTHLSTSSVIGGIAARLAGVPSVATVHGLSGKLSFSFVDHLIAVAHEAARHLERQGVPSSRISVVHNGISIPDLSHLEPAAERRRLGLENCFPILSTSSRVSALKGIPEALRAVAAVIPEFPNLRYLLLGDGDEMAQMEALAHELGISAHVRFVGYTQDVWPYLRASHAFIFPSRKEALPMAIIEAMAAGLPIIGTKVGGIPELIDDRCGALVPSEDPAALAAAVAALASSPVRMQAQGAHAHERAAAHFSDDAMATGAELVYRNLIRRGPAVRDRIPAVECETSSPIRSR